jgi:hypothetical protein
MHHSDAPQLIQNAYNLMGAHTITSFVLLKTGFGIGAIRVVEKWLLELLISSPIPNPNFGIGEDVGWTFLSPSVSIG